MNFPEHDVRCHYCGKTWRDTYPDQPGAIIWCGDCARVEAIKVGIDKPIDPAVVGDRLERQLFTDEEIIARRIACGLLGWCIRCMTWVETDKGYCPTCGATTAGRDLSKKEVIQ